MLFVRSEESKQLGFFIGKCKWCGREYVRVNNRQMYCSDDCAKYAHMEQKAEFSRKYYRMHNQKEIGKCKWCGKEFEKSHNTQRYCSEACVKYAHMEHNAEYMRKYRRRYAQKESLGSGGLGAHLKSNFAAEYSCIQREKKRLRLAVGK